MFVELVDHLRCPRQHEETWLVLHAEESRDRHVIRGMLGCPICMAQFVVADGTAWFAAGDRADAAGMNPQARDHDDEGASPTASDGADWPLRLAAFLDLAEGRGAVALYGDWARHAEALGDVAESVELVAIAPAVATHPMLSAIVPPSRADVPLAAGSLRAAALDRSSSASADVAEAARLVRTGGRILAPADVDVPPGVRELARDAHWWVGEREAQASGVVSIVSRRQG